MVDYLKRTAVVLLNYNSFQDTVNCIHQLKEIGVEKRSIIVVDNHSTNESIDHLKLEKVNLVQSKVNKGYGAGNNLGLLKAIELGFQYVCVMNSDIQFEYDFLTPLIKRLDNHSNIGVIGPTILTRQTKKIFSQGGFFHFYSGKAYFDKIKNLSHKDGMIDVDYISGACLVTRAATIKQVGLIPEVYFLNFEDNEWCLNFKKNELKVVCDLHENVIHEGESTINTISGLQTYFLRRNMVLFEKRNANFVQFIIFFTRLSFRMVRNLVLKKNKGENKAFIDGIFERNRYSYLIK